MRGTLGLGAAARLYVEAVAAAGLDVSTTTVDVPAAGDDVQFAEVDFEDRAGSGPEVPGVDIVCVNADELPMFAARMGDRFGAARRTIGVWAWETDHIPERWGPMYGMVDEIWTYTRYVAENIARVAPVPVIPIPIPVPTPDPSGVELDLGLPDADFTFLFVFDFFSTPARKNPAGLIEAFTRAFRPGEGPRLIIKTLHGDLRPAALDRLRLARRRPRGPRHPPRRPVALAARARRAHGLVRLLRLAPPRRGLRPDPRRGDGPRQAGHRDRLQRDPRLHEPDELVPRRLHDDQGRPRGRALPGRRASGPTPRSSTPRSSCATSSSTRPTRRRREPEREPTSRSTSRRSPSDA
jgi:hypothetical protein